MHRTTWAVELLGPEPGDSVLEVGCGSGRAAALVAERLREGHLVAIDRSTTAIERARAHLAPYVEAGTVELRTTELAGFRSDRVFDRVLAVNVNVFWTSPATPELQRLAAVAGPGSIAVLAYEWPGAVRHDAHAAVVEACERHGFTADTVTGPRPGLAAVVAHRTRTTLPHSGLTT